MASETCKRPVNRLSTVVGPLQLLDLDLLHLEHGLHDPLGLRAIRIIQHFAENGGVHLPRQAEFVLEPAAGSFFSAGREFLPVVIDFALGLAVDGERDRLGELEVRAAIQRDESLPIELELHGHDAAGGAGPRFAIAAHADDLGVLEDRHVVLGGLLGLRVEPQERGDLRHRVLAIGGWSAGTMRHRARRRARPRLGARPGTTSARAPAWRPRIPRPLYSTPAPRSPMPGRGAWARMARAAPRCSRPRR